MLHVHVHVHVSTSIYNCTLNGATALCNTAITIEGGKLACAHTQNRTLCNVFTDTVTYYTCTYVTRSSKIQHFE